MPDTLSGPGVPFSDLDPFAMEFLADPYPQLELLRDLAPVFLLQRYGVYGVARHAEVQAVLNDHAAFCSGRGAGLQDFARETPWRPPSLLLEADPPEHTGRRRVVSRVLGPPAVAQLRAGFAAAAQRLVASLLQRGRIDGITELAQIFPLEVFPDAVGLPPEGREHLLPYGGLAFNAFGPDNELRRAALAHAAPHVAYVTQQTQRENLRPGGFGAQIWEAADRGEISAEEAPLLVRSLLTAGLDTTVHAIGAALFCMVNHPDQFQRLRQTPNLVRGAFAEALRLENPVQTFFRTSTRAVRIGDATIPEGSKVLCFLAAANRDPRKWESPDSYDIGRRTIGHVAFGSGIHMCVGQLIAALEAEVMLAALAEQVAEILPDGPPARAYNNTLRGLASLPLRLVAA